MRTLYLFVFFILLSAAPALSQTAVGGAQTEPFLMPVEDVFSIAGRGVVATGKIERGQIKVGDKIEIVGLKATKTATISGIEMFRKLLTEAKAGDNVGIMLRGVEKADVERGQVLAAPNSVKTYTKFKATIDFKTAIEGGRKTPAFTGYRPQIVIRNANMSGVLTLPSGTSSIAPGDKAVSVEIELTQPAVLEKGQAITLREYGKTIATGTVTEMTPLK